MSYDNTNRGSIWPNKEKTMDTHPDFKGTVNIEGVEYFVSAWKRKEGAKPNAPSLTFSVKPKQESYKQGIYNVKDKLNQSSQPSSEHPPTFDDDIPF